MCACVLSVYACNYILCTVYVSGDIILHFCINVLVSKSSLYSNFNHEVPFALHILVREREREGILHVD